MPRVRHLPPRPDLAQLTRQANELLEAYVAGAPEASIEVQAYYPGADSTRFALQDAQLVLARVYGFDSWPRLTAFVDDVSRRPGIKPRELDSQNGDDTWNTIVAASAGDVVTLRRLLARPRPYGRCSTPVPLASAKPVRVVAVRCRLRSNSNTTTSSDCSSSAV